MTWLDLLAPSQPSTPFEDHRGKSCFFISHFFLAVSFPLFALPEALRQEVLGRLDRLSRSLFALTSRSNFSSHWPDIMSISNMMINASSGGHLGLFHELLTMQSFLDSADLSHSVAAAIEGGHVDFLKNVNLPLNSDEFSIPFSWSERLKSPTADDFWAAGASGNLDILDLILPSGIASGTYSTASIFMFLLGAMEKGRKDIVLLAQSRTLPFHKVPKSLDDRALRMLYTVRFYQYNMIYITNCFFLPLLLVILNSCCPFCFLGRTCLLFP